MALVVLIAIWGVFLGVALVRKRAEFRADSSIGAFQRQLQVLRRNSAVSNLRAGFADESEGVAVTRVQEREQREDPFFRPEARERRRDVLLIFVSIVVSTGLISIIPAARVMLVLTGISGVLLATYVALLVRSQARATERTMKLRYMPRVQEAPSFADRRLVAPSYPDRRLVAR